MRATSHRAGFALLGSVVLVSLMIGPATPAVAAPTAATAAQATELRVEVDRLRVEVALAVEAHNAVADQLAGVVRRALHADRAADAAQLARAESEDRGARRTRAFYMAGGSASLYAGLLQEGDITDVLRRAQTVTALARGDVGAIDADRQLASAANGAVTELTALTSEQMRLRLEEEAAATTVTTLLAETTDRLAGADSEVVRLAAAERSRLETTAEDAATVARGPDQEPAPAAAAAVAAALSVLGRPYSWGAVGPQTFDCSGLIQWSYARAGVGVPRVSRDQFGAGTPVSLSALAPGDILFYALDTADPRSIYHVGMYLGEGRLLQSPRTGEVVQIAPVRRTDLIGAIRPVTSQPSPRKS